MDSHTKAKMKTPTPKKQGPKLQSVPRRHPGDIPIGDQQVVSSPPEEPPEVRRPPARARRAR
jgi:hypothetical protein